MKNPSTLFLPLAALSLASCSGQKKEEAKQPNIIFMMTDDHTTQAMSCYGGNLIQTPNKHPINSNRCSYLMEEVQYLHPENEYQIYIDLLNKVWIKNKKKICRQVNNIHGNYNKYTDILENVSKRMKNILDSISDKDL